MQKVKDGKKINILLKKALKKFEKDGKLVIPNNPRSEEIKYKEEYSKLKRMYEELQQKEQNNSNEDIAVIQERVKAQGIALDAVKQENEQLKEAIDKIEDEIKGVNQNAASFKAKPADDTEFKANQQKIKEGEKEIQKLKERLDQFPEKGRGKSDSQGGVDDLIKAKDDIEAQLNQKDEKIAQLEQNLMDIDNAKEQEIKNLKSELKTLMSSKKDRGSSASKKGRSTSGKGGKQEEIKGKEKKLIPIITLKEAKAISYELRMKIAVIRQQAKEFIKVWIIVKIVGLI
jgi:chromosome segregation ATPase